MQPSPLLLSGLSDYWHQLSDGTRDNIVGGLILAAVLGLFGLLLKFGKRIWNTIARLFKSESIPVNPQQEVKVKIEVVPTAPTLPDVPKPPQTARLPLIPRPPVFGFVARRDQEGRDIVERLKEELAPEKDQLIVLWGAGGVGKTTLAAEATRALRKIFDGGIAWISAEGRPEFGLSTLLDEIATHLRRPDLRQLALEQKDEQVHQALADAPTPLVVLDNFETVSPDEQVACASWLAKRASCAALLTSRDEAPHSRPIHILAMSLPEAQEFLKKLVAQARNPQAFVGLDHDQIIQAADRIPLVLQWVVKQIDSAKQPQTVLADLAHGQGDAAQRVFDRSFELPQLGDDGRVTLLALSLFVPSASRAALAEVSGFGDDSDRLNRAVQQLADLWLISTTVGNERLSVEGLTREFAKAHLRKHEHADEIRRRFIANSLSYTQAHKQPTPENYDALEIEKDNLLNAMDVASELKDWDSVQLIAFPLIMPAKGMLSVHGYWDETMQRGKQALEAARAANNEYHIGAFANALGTMFVQLGDYSSASEHYQLAVEIARRLGEDQGLSATLHQLAMLAGYEGDLPKAHGLYNESLELSRKCRDEQGIASTTHQLGQLAEKEGDLPEARRLYNESLQIKEKMGNQSGIAITLNQLASVAQSEGDLDKARSLCNKSLKIRRKLRDQIGIAFALYQLGRIAEAESNNVEAARLFGEALAIFEKLKSPHMRAARRSLERVGDKT